MRRIKGITLAVCLLVTMSATAAAQNSMSSAQEKTLYQRLGGYDAVAAVVDDFIGRLIADDRFAKFFKGASDDSKKRIRQHIVDQFCAAAGGPCVYTGRDMKTSHKGLGITEDEWNGAAK